MKEKCLILFIFILCFVFATSIEAKTGHKKKSKKVVSITHNVETPIAALNNVKEYEIITKTFPLNYIEPQVMADKLKIAFSSITVLCDDDTNSLSVSVSSNSLKDIANFIAKSDIKEETIGIKIIFLELNENYTQNIITSDSAFGD